MPQFSNPPTKTPLPPLFLLHFSIHPLISLSLSLSTVLSFLSKFQFFNSAMSTSAFSKPLHYPSARRDDSVVDNYFGHLIPDPYRWLEDPNLEETKEFVKNQVKLTETVLKECDLREKLKEKITELYKYPRYTAPFKRGDKYFYFHNTGLQPQDVLYFQESLDAKPKVLLDPNQLSDDGTVALYSYSMSVSEDAKYLAYGLSSNGSDWVTIRVKRIEDGSVLPDTLSWVKFSSIGWTHDSKGFFYARFPPPKEGHISDVGTETDATFNQKVYYHFLGTNQTEDVLCWRDPSNPDHFFFVDVTEDGKYVLLNTIKNSDMVNKVYYLDLTALPDGLQGFRGGNDLLPFAKLVDKFDASYDLVANDDTVFTFRTNKEAPRYKLVRVDLKTPGIWTDVIPQSEKDLLKSAVAVNKNQLLVSYLRDVKSVLEVRDLESGSMLHQLPLDIGSVDDISAQRKDSIVILRFTSFLTPGIVYQCDLNSHTPEMKIFREIIIPEFDHSEFQVDQVFVSSKDGTKIPMFIVARKGISLDGSHPCLLYGYGGFNLSLTPSFDINRIVLLKHLGVVCCIANIRGGGEYGKEWHKAGSRANKQNSFDDFISTAEFLVSNGYTQFKKLCIEGLSNGGILVTACINQRPDIFGCALAHVAVTDMLRYHKFTMAHVCTPEMGRSDNEEEFNWLIKYSPLHNVRRPWEKSSDDFSQYPATVLLTADHDDRVVPLHTYKLLATMQYVLCKSSEKGVQTNPIIGRIECNAGHGLGRPIQKQIDEAADRYSFMSKVVNAPWVD